MFKLGYRRPPEPIEHVEFWIDDENDVPIADIKRNGHGSEALARLLSASPDTTTALKELLRVVREIMEPELNLYAKHHDGAPNWQDDEVNKAVEAADAALEKATI